jgi:hypothetical protein
VTGGGRGGWRPSPHRRRSTVAGATMLLVAGLAGGCSAGSTGGPGTGEGTSGGWEITVYYTAVEQHHDGPLRQVRGCLQLECEGGDDDLGSYPGDFVDAVEGEGTGRITGGPHAGEYLNWSYDVGFWLDTAPRDSYGDVLEPFSSAAADGDVLARGTRFRVAECGRTDDGSEPPGETCERLRDAPWAIVDEFTPGLGGDHHVDLYVGEETGPDFTEGDLYITLVDADLSVTS